MSNNHAKTRDILAEGTGAANSDQFRVGRGEKVVITLYPAANLASETAALKVLDPNGTYVAVARSGTAVALSATNNVYVIDFPGVFRLEAGARTAAWGIALTE